jgi:hypothetical protein
MENQTMVPKRGRPAKTEATLEAQDVKKNDVKIKNVPAKTEATLEVSKDEYKIEVIKDYYGKIDVFNLSKKDPRFEYRFLRDDFKNLSKKTNNLLFDGGGWELCQRDHLLKLGITERFIAPDGLYRVGDTILARMPKELYAEKIEVKRKRAAAPMSMVKRLVKEGDPDIGGKEIHESMKGIQTQKQLGM